MDVVISSETDFYAKGLAIGCIDMARDVWLYRFRDENYELSSPHGWAHMSYVNRFPASSIEWVRKVGARV